MATIEQNSGYATLINVFTVAPDRAADLAALLHTATEKVMRHQPGFRSANIHLSIDGTRVVNYAQWRSDAAYSSLGFAAGKNSATRSRETVTPRGMRGKVI